MHGTALQSPVSFSRQAHDHAERCVERALDADMVAALAWGRMRLAQQRLCERKLSARVHVKRQPAIVAA